ncbi:hypothetical protein DNTS_021693 [Danionella cerebrum]|uniref:Interleukin-6 n=1 Tax=Danionella cerebrum TaxID=2873325 RepID=A0A553P5D0_9TELE|nr:hypothetical protein DNTS_021693 [Danionella translucida]
MSSSTKLNLFLVLMVPIFSSLGDLSEISGDESQDTERNSELSEEQRWHLMARDLYRHVKMLRDLQFERDFPETMNMTEFESVRINTPVLKASDRCLARNFSSYHCLQRIHSILTWYRENWSFIERENLTPELVKTTKLGTTRLLEAVQSKLQGEASEQTSSAPLEATSAWTRKTLVHSLLFHLTQVSIDASRALAYMSRRSSAGRPVEP